jgi:Trm5-related predicted tRNA methylase
MKRIPLAEKGVKLNVDTMELPRTSALFIVLIGYAICKQQKHYVTGARLKKRAFEIAKKIQAGECSRDKAR